jgi:antitoxin MazE
MRVRKWNDKLAVCIPAAVVRALELKEGDEIEVRIAGWRTLEVSRAPDRSERLKALRRFRGRLPADFAFDRDEANAR